jgi:MFS family permease
MKREATATRTTTRVAQQLSVFRERNFRLFFVGYTTSLVGASMVPVALTFAVLNDGFGTADIGYVLAAETLPLVALLLLGGVLADRFPRRASMLGADVLRFGSEGVLAVLLLTGSPPLWVFMVLAGILGTGQAFFNPAMVGLMPEIVAPENLQRANALRGVAGSTGQILGPSLAGVIVATAGAGWAIGVDSLTYAVSAYCLLHLAIPRKPASGTKSLLGQLHEGWREFSSRTWLWAIVAQFAAFTALGFAPFMVLGAVVAHTRLGGAGAWGVVLAAFGVGGILGGLISTTLHVRRPLVTATLGTATFTLLPALTAIPASTAVLAIAAGISGIGLSIFDTLWETTIQHEVPGEALSRVSSYDWFGSIVFMPIGYALAGPLAVLLGTRSTLILAAIVTATSCAAVLANPSVRALRERAPVEAQQKRPPAAEA